MKKENRNNKGFSLVELIVVIAIMAVLVGVLAPQFIKYVEKSRQATDIQTADNVATALKTYYSDKENLTSDVTITLQHSPAAAISDPAIEDAGLKKASLKSKNWTKITVTYKATGAAAGNIEYGIDSTGRTGTCYYTVSADKSQIVVE